MNHEELKRIRTKELQRQKDSRFNTWVSYYKDYLDEIYDIFLKYKYISYDDFLILAYDCTLDYYDYKCRCNKKYLI